MNESLKIKLLPAALICHGFVKGEPDCNYEVYLREVVNASEFFMRKSNKEKYCAPIQESNGENDCFTSQYSFDFKLMASESLLQAMNIFSKSINVIAPGCVSYGYPKVRSNDAGYKPIEATKIYAALRGLDMSELEEIRAREPKKQCIEKDICSLMKKMEVQKNILFFFPYVFCISEKDDFDTTINFIIKEMNADFTEILKYRIKIAPCYETHVIFLFKDIFIITDVIDGRMELVDQISTNISPTFNKLNSLVSWA